MTDRNTHTCRCDVLTGAHVPVERMTAPFQPGSDLLDRAQAGWERFLGTFEAACDE
ncbi:hypothetical protein [Streptomyces sp. NPDC031705]|uniref:hypothetical protein n=1 Tax=Streptomyces sp. NPDC031705 TaxID=3155729 RepID=UPI0033ED5D35